jgi:uncharacterized protein YjiK
MQKFLLPVAGILALYSFNTHTPLYSISQIPLPAEMDKQVCISGMVYEDHNLYFASERCPMIIVAKPENGAIQRTINIQVPHIFEMEGMTAYDNNLYLISENIAGVYEVDVKSGALRSVQTSNALPEKSKSGDGMEGIAANRRDKKFYLLRERNEDMTRSQIFTYRVEGGTEGKPLSLVYESMIELPLENPQWRYSDICYDADDSRLLCLKSYAKGKLRKQFIESIQIDKDGKLLVETVKDVPVENFSSISNQYKDQDYSMNLEGITIDTKGNLFVVSDNTSGKAQCDMAAKERTILLQLKKVQQATDKQ